MYTNSIKELDTKMLNGIANVIHLLVETRHGPQKYAGREIECAIHVVLLMVKAATRHESDKQRLQHFQTAVAMFADIAESDYILATPTPLHTTKFAPASPMIFSGGSHRPRIGGSGADTDLLGRRAV